MTCPGRAEVLSISEDGDVFARVTASYDMLMTQRLILQPEVEINFAASGSDSITISVRPSDRKWK